MLETQVISSSMSILYTTKKNRTRFLSAPTFDVT